MKRAVCALVVSLQLVSSAYAGTILVQPGHRATSMGGAFTAVANDATAIYYNPAGLTQLEGSGVEVSGFYVDSKANSSKSLGNTPTAAGANDFPLPNIYGIINPALEPASYNSKELTVTAFLPFAAGYTKIKDINIGVGIYGLGGGTGKWSDTVKTGPGDINDLSASVDSTYGLIVGNISAAKKVADNVAVGIGLDIMRYQNKAEVTKTYVAGPGSPVPDYRLYLNSDGAGNGFQAVGGVLYTPIDPLRLGLTLRSGASIDVKGKATTNLVGSAESDFTQHYQFPFTCGLGAAYDATKKLTLAFSVDFADYYVAKNNIHYDQNNAVFVDTDQKLGWESTAMYSLGADYKIDEKFSVQGGVRRDPGIIPADKSTFLGTEQYSLTTFTLGGEYNIKSFNVGISIARNFSDKVSRNGVEYELPSTSYRAGATYKF